MKTTTVSDLKQHLSARLQTVKSGESFLVTERRVPVAMISPLPSGTGDADLSELVAAGVLIPPRGTLNIDRWRWPSSIAGAPEYPQKGSTVSAQLEETND